MAAALRRKVGAAAARAAAIGAVLSLIGCASAPRDQSLPVFAHVAIISSDQSASDFNANSTTEKATVGAAGGAAAGAATGALVGLICGPFAVICSPLFAAGGGITGAIAGGVINAQDGLSSAAAEEVSQVLARVDERRDFIAELHAAVAAGVPPNRQRALDDAEAVVLLAINRIDLQQYGHGQVALRITGSMTVTWNRGKQPANTQRNDYQYETGQDTVEQWLLDDGARFDQGISECIERMSQRVLHDLRTGQPVPNA